MPLFDVTLRNLGKPDVAKVVQVHAASAAQAGEQAKREGWGVALIKPRKRPEEELKTCATFLPKN